MKKRVMARAVAERNSRQHWTEVKNLENANQP